MPLNMDTSSGAVGDFLTQAAGSALPQSGATGGPANQINPELLKKIMSLGQGSSFAGPMTTAQTAMPQAKPPIQVNPATPQVGGADRSFATKGEAQRAKQQATLNNLANLAKMGEDYEYQKKKREMETIVTKFQGANEGVQQAKDILKQDPNNADAKGQLEHNQGILDDMKIKDWKMIQKAFDVPLIGDKGKQTPEYQGMISAVKKGSKEDIAAANQQMLQRFNQQQPMEQKPSLQAQSASMAQKMGLSPTQQQQLEYAKSAVQNIRLLQTNINNTDARNKLTDVIFQNKKAEIQEKYFDAIGKALGKKYEADQRANVRLKGISALQDMARQKQDSINATNLLIHGVIPPPQGSGADVKQKWTELKDLEKSRNSRTTNMKDQIEENKTAITALNAKVHSGGTLDKDDIKDMAKYQSNIKGLMLDQAQVTVEDQKIKFLMDQIYGPDYNPAGPADSGENKQGSGASDDIGALGAGIFAGIDAEEAAAAAAESNTQ